MRSRIEVVNLLDSWLGKNETDGSYKEIIDIYNSYGEKLPRGLKMNYNWAWCAVTWSALAIKLGYTDIMPIEMSCGLLVNEAKKMGVWEEKDGYVPRIADAVLYSWSDPVSNYKSTDNTKWPDHVGTVTYVNKNGGYFEVIEGNYDDKVKKRTISINGRYIRGFITPKYDEIPMYPVVPENKDLSTIAHEVIVGKWGNGPERKEILTSAGYDYEVVRNEVNRILNGDAVTTENPKQSQRQPFEKRVTATCYASNHDNKYAGTYFTTANLYCRNDAGTNKKALCLIPKGVRVKNYGYFTMFKGEPWLYIRAIIDGVCYTGFSSISYLNKVN